MSDRVHRSWEEFLNPDVMRPHLMSVSIYIAAFESLKESIIGRIRDFFTIGLNETGDVIDPKYQTEVLSRNPSPVYASLDWLKKHGAIDDGDIEVFDRVKNCRNDLAHRLLKLLGTQGIPPDFSQRFEEMVGLLHKIEVWWIKNVEIATDPDFDYAGADLDAIVPGRVLALRLLVDIALQSDEQSRYYYEEFRKRVRKTTH